MLTFYDFPAEHWDHLRTSNPIESVFATVRHRTVRTKGALSQDTARLMRVQARHGGRRQDMAQAEGREPVAQGRPARHIPKRRRGYQHASPERRLITASPRLQHSSTQDHRGHSRDSVHYGGGSLVLVRPLPSSAPRRCATRGWQWAVRASLRSGRRLPRGHGSCAARHSCRNSPEGARKIRARWPTARCPVSR